MRMPCKSHTTAGAETSGIFAAITFVAQAGNIHHTHRGDNGGALLDGTIFQVFHPLLNGGFRHLVELIDPQKEKLML